ncbi:DUF4139 domain-containing protein [Streptomyces globosus]|uniref:DUF4139 domain-containing protein n=1 Tax=Streptomyces globosus TaxID=68209 RepID=UPI0038217ED6
MTARTARWESTLDSVVVYAQGALCRRLACGTVPPDGRLRVTGLPRSLDPGSLRARVLGAPRVRVVEARVEVEAEPADPRTPHELREAAERLRDRHAAVQARRDRQLTLIEEAGGLHPAPPARRREDAQRRTPVEAWLELADFVDRRLAALQTRLAELEEELLRAGHELAVAEDRLARASGDAPQAHVAATVSAVLTLARTGAPGTAAEAAAGVEVGLEVEYGVPGAVWVPAYRLAHRQGDDTGRLVLRASVAQRTGEDWNGVRIALATSDLRRRTDLPRLHSVRIGRRQPAPAPSGWREPPAGLADLFAGYAAAGPRPAPPAPAPAATRPGAATGPVQPLPPPAMPVQPVPQAYGAPPPAMPAPAAPAPPGFGAAPDFAPQGPPRPAARRARSGAPAALAAPGGLPPGAPAAPAPAPAAAPAPAGPPRPSGAELDYSALVLAGPDDQAARRGRLFPGAPSDPVGAEQRRRAEAVAALPLPGHAVRPRESAGSFDHRFDAAARADVPSDGTWHTVTVGEVPLGLRTEYVCVPSAEQTVYATLVLSNATGQALLAGPVEVTVGDEFLLTAALPTLAPGAVSRLGLGPADGVRVTRRTNLHESAAGLRGGTTVLDHRVHVELANRLSRPVTVEVRERVPVASDADVRIEERADWKAPEPGAGPEDHAPGTRIWRVELPAGGATALDGRFEIRIPAAKALVGGNRRS